MQHELMKWVQDCLIPNNPTPLHVGAVEFSHTRSLGNHNFIVMVDGGTDTLVLGGTILTEFNTDTLVQAVTQALLGAALDKVNLAISVAEENITEFKSTKEKL